MCAISLREALIDQALYYVGSCFCMPYDAMSSATNSGHLNRRDGLMWVIYVAALVIYSQAVWAAPVRDHRPSGFGDLTVYEVRRITTAFRRATKAYMAAGYDSSRMKLFVLGSTARGERRNINTNLPLQGRTYVKDGTRSDIDYFLAPRHVYLNYELAVAIKQPLQHGLPDVGWHGVLFPELSNYDGPAILFQWRQAPTYYWVDPIGCKFDLE